MQLAHKKTGIPIDVKPYTVTKLSSIQGGTPSFYQIFAFPYNSLEELHASLTTPAMQEIAADAVRISTGGPPIMMIGTED